MKPYANDPLTPRMRQGLKALLTQDPLDFATTSIGRPSKQRLAKFGLARYIYDPRTHAAGWDGPMEITRKGRKVMGAL